MNHPSHPLSIRSAKSRSLDNIPNDFSQPPQPQDLVSSIQASIPSSSTSFRLMKPPIKLKISSHPTPLLFLPTRLPPPLSPSFHYSPISPPSNSNPHIHPLTHYVFPLPPPPPLPPILLYNERILSNPHGDPSTLHPPPSIDSTNYRPNHEI